ncbi:exo-alpha-sialidase [Changchengzhania lutea]|uniref:exo-alpha-sialidase n=1 Tax=Changchengzhania lutea TaxID=2049305 RepID=UPI00163DB119|nr:exo-alpha-sialidase [Changchengzhania lutea]
MLNAGHFNIFLLASFLVLTGCKTQSQQIDIGLNISLISKHNSIAYTEPYIAVNPIDSKNLVVGTIKIKDSGWESVVFCSNDAGKSWTERNLPIPDSVSRSGDPYLAYSDKGALYCTMLGSTQKGMGQLVFKSNDNGVSWSQSAWVSTKSKWMFDHSTVVIDNNQESPFYGNIYAASHVNYRDENSALLYAAFVSVSNDGGGHFFLEGIHGSTLQNMNNGDAVITSDGTIYFFYFLFMDNNGNWLDKHLLYVITSTDGGGTFSKPMLVSDEFTAYYPNSTIDRSSKFKDQIYVSWTYTKN